MLKGSFNLVERHLTIVDSGMIDNSGYKEPSVVALELFECVTAEIA
ncbi:MAG: hypothetical protein K1V78_03855 [Muribaculaceae bacterium]